MQLYYRTFGNGPEPLLAFHGIGHTGALGFQSYEQVLGKLYTIYAFDLPFHGNSSAFFNDVRWETGNDPITPEEWRSYMTDFLKENHIENFSLVGFSLGGRFAIETLDAFFPRVRKAFLIAPDGVKNHFMYKLATEMRIFRSVFNLVMKNPTLLLQVAVKLNNMKLLDSGLFKILRLLTSTNDHARQVFLSWVNFRKLKARPTLFAKGDSLNKKLFILLGTYDKIITRRQIAPLRSVLLPENVLYLETSHFGCIEKAIPAIKELS